MLGNFLLLCFDVKWNDFVCSPPMHAFFRRWTTAKIEKANKWFSVRLFFLTAASLICKANNSNKMSLTLIRCRCCWCCWRSSNSRQVIQLCFDFKEKERQGTNNGSIFANSLIPFCFVVWYLICCGIQWNSRKGDKQLDIISSHLLNCRKNAVNYIQRGFSENEVIGK